MIRILYKIIAVAIITVIITPVQFANADEFDSVLNAAGGGTPGGDLLGTDPPRSIPSGADWIVSPAPGSVWHTGSAANNSTAKSTLGELLQKKFEWAQTFVLEALKKRILDMMVDEIVRWVQGGDSPKFVTDWQQFLSDAGNVALGDLATRIGGAGLCQPFRQNILNSLLVPEPGRFSNSSYGSSITCTLDDIVGNIESFYEDFNNGGWEGYNASWQIQNNPISVFIMTESAKYQTIANAQKVAELEALAGNGFLSSRTCFEDPKSTGPDLDKDGTKGDISSTCRITTPGSFIGDIVGKAVGSDIDYIVNAQQLAAYVAAIGDALWNRLVREGVGGLASVSTDNSPGSGTVDPADDFIPEGAEGCESLGSPSLRDACRNYVESNNNNFGLTRTTLLTNIQNVKNGLVALRPALVSWKEVADALNTFIADESVDRPAECISDALEPHFTNSTPAGVANYATSVSGQLTTVDERITLLDTYTTQLEAIPSDDPDVWSAFTLLASNIQGQLAIFQVSDDAKERADAQREELNVAFEIDIRPDVLMCH